MSGCYRRGTFCSGNCPVGHEQNNLQLFNKSIIAKFATNWLIGVRVPNLVYE